MASDGFFGIPVPAASRRAHVLAAGVLWSLAGTGLLAAGGYWVTRSRPITFVPVLGLSLGLGLLKARLILDGAAGRIVDRIESRGDGRCLGGFLSWRSWLLVAAMILLGRALRASPLPVLARGAIYTAIGAAILIASRRLWAGSGSRRPAGPAT